MMKLFAADPRSSASRWDRPGQLPAFRENEQALDIFVVALDGRQKIFVHHRQRPPALADFVSNRLGIKLLFDGSDPHIDARLPRKIDDRLCKSRAQPHVDLSMVEVPHAARERHGAAPSDKPFANRGGRLREPHALLTLGGKR